MSVTLFRSKDMRRGAAGVSAIALVLAAAAPTTVSAQPAPPITLHRSCSADDKSDSDCLNNVQVAVPIAVQFAKQTATLKPSVDNDQSNTVDQSASNNNNAWATSSNDQDLKAIQVGADQSNDQDLTQKVSAEASNPAIGGKAVAIGPTADVTFDLTQESDASAHGNAVAVTKTGPAGGDARASGTVTTTGGNAGASSEADGGNGNGNVKGSSEAEQSKSGNAAASTDAWAGDGGNSKAEGGDATGHGGSGGDGGNADNGGNGNDAEANSLAASIAAAIAKDDDSVAKAMSDQATSGDASNKSNSGASNGGSGGSGGGGGAGGGDAWATAGRGGDANGNTSDASGWASNTSGAVTGKSSGDNGNATSSATGGNASAGGGNGNTAIGGRGDSGYNLNDARVAGGSSQNILGVSFTQSAGPTTASGGAATNNGWATASPIVTGTNKASQDAPQTQNTTQKGGPGAISQDQDAASKQSSDPLNKADNRISSTLDQKSGGTNSATSGASHATLDP